MLRGIFGAGLRPLIRPRPQHDMTEPVTNRENADIDDEPEESDAASDGVRTAAAEADDDDSEGDRPRDGAKAAADAEAGAEGTADASERDGSNEVAALREELADRDDRHLRLAAEFNNFRRRSEQERVAAWSRAQADLLSHFVDVLDDLHRVAELDLSTATVEVIMEGIDLVERKFLRALGDAGVEVIDPTGDTFDPELMEAMMRLPAESDAQVDTVAQVFQKGYSLKGILVRPARVSVYTQG